MNHPPGLKLPVELWREAFGNVVSQRDRAALMRVCRSFNTHARTLLYQFVILRSHRQAHKFYFALLRFPQMAAITQHLCINVVTRWEGIRVPTFVPRLFHLLVNVRHFDLGYYLSLPQEIYHMDCDLFMHTNWFPRLISFTTNIPLSSELNIPKFLKAHPALEELYVAQAENDDSHNLEDICPPTSFANLRVVSCVSQLLHETTPQSMASITHLDIHLCTEEDVTRVAELLGSRLLSLRISRARFAGKGWVLYKIITLFPHIRLLHVDMVFSQDTKREPVRPQICLQPIDWFEKLNLYNCDAPQRELQVIWSYKQVPGFDNAIHGSSWRNFLTAFALEIFTAWKPYLSTITFVHPALWEVTYSLAPDEMTVVRRSDVAINQRSWRYA